MKLLHIAALFLVSAVFAVSVVQGKPAIDDDDDDDKYDEYVDDGYDYDGDDDDYNSDVDSGGTDENDYAIKDVPNFVTRGSTFTVDKGTTIRLPCYVDRLPKNFVLMWNRINPRSGQKSMVAMDKMLMGNDPRISVEVGASGSDHGSSLIISLAKDEDAGQYICEMGTGGGQAIKHTVHIRAPPTIVKFPENGIVLAEKGDEVSLSCVGEGKPEPVITWTRVGKHLPDGSTTVVASELVYPNVNRHHAGIYMCAANNGYGQEAKEKIEVVVEYEPEVSVEEMFIHAKDGDTVELVCVVHARPKADVRWLKDGVDITANAAAPVQHNRHTLILESLEESEMGVYTCAAKNNHGEGLGVIEISGKAAPAVFQSKPSGYEPNKYLIEWNAVSHTPIFKFELLYRRHSEPKEVWRRLEVEPKKQDSMTWAGKHSLSGLGGAAQYEARVRTENAEGWNNLSLPFQFATFGAAPLQTGLTSGATMFSSTLTLVLVLLVAVTNGLKLIL